VISFFENLGLSPLVIVILEERYPIKKKLWIRIVYKAKQRLLKLLQSMDNNENHDQLEILPNELREQV
jgi:hypothetical protein